jgi:uncharacterized damage-inducible protein DinB
VNAPPEECARTFLEFSRRTLVGEYWPRTCACLEPLSDDQVWWRPNEQSNSIGNLLLHLNGNLRQWVVAPLSEPSSVRNRSAEFAERSQIAPRVLRQNLAGTLEEIDSILNRLNSADLLKKYTIQDLKGVTALEAIYHAVEHFSMHYGQILYIAKLLTGADLGFYRDLDK